MVSDSSLLTDERTPREADVIARSTPNGVLVLGLEKVDARYVWIIGGSRE